MRVMALYSQSKSFRLSIFLQSLFAVEAAFMLGNLLYGNISVKIAILGLAKGITLCGDHDSLPVFWMVLYWIAPVVYELILMALAVYKAVEFWRTSAGFKGFTLVKVLIQDQILYFIVVIACSLMQIITFRSSLNPAFANFLDTVGNASFLCVIGSRLLIHLKEVGERNVDGTTVVSYSLRTIC
ncbi:hypothetical protein DFH11DRAFT_1712022 [Phellopilus nigrolimitatus]|nr:hypothetical protein DFH11DRAFT_1712022 [Phellopilus nigrolimitatus]